MDEGTGGRREAWPPLGRGATGMGTMHRPNAPPSLTLPVIPTTSSQASSTSSPAVPTLKSSSSRVAVGSPLNPSLYSVSPPPTLPTSAPLVRHRTAPGPSLRITTRLSPESASPAALPSSPLVPSGSRGSGDGGGDVRSVASASPVPGHPAFSCYKTVLNQHHQRRQQHQRHGRELSESSTETVRGPPLSATVRSTLSNDSSRANSISSNPMTPFPRYDTYDESSISGSPNNNISRTPSAACADLHTKYQLEEMMTATGRPRAPLVLVLQEGNGHSGREGFPYLRRRLSSSSMHGFVLGIQCFILLVVSSALVWVTVWKRTKSSADFWSWLWRIAEPSVGILLLLCFSTLMAHEVRGLSAVAHLYLQAAILVVATFVAGALVVRCLEQESRTVKGVITGCCAWMWASALLGFLRAAVVWKMEAMDSGDGEAEAEAIRRQNGEAVAYGTFVLVDQRSG